jgi:hypothetical protein
MTGGLHKGVNSMTEKLSIRYVTFTTLLSLAVILTGIAFSELMLFLFMPLFWILEIYMLLHYPSYINHNIRSETVPSLLMWNTRIFLAHLLLGISICIPIYLILLFGQMDFEGATIFFIPYAIGLILSHITAVKSCIPLLQFAIMNDLIKPKTAKFYKVMHAVPIFGLIGAIMMDIHITRKLSNF